MREREEWKGKEDRTGAEEITKTQEVVEDGSEDMS